MDGFDLLRPAWLLALLPLALLLCWLFRKTGSATPWQSVVDAHLLRHLLLHDDPKRHTAPLILLGIAWSLAVVALAGPAWERVPPLQFRPDVPPLVIALDLSRSMETRDITPTRLTVAKAKLRQLLQQLPQRPVALIAYAGSSHSVMPFTEDRRLLQETLTTLTPSMMPKQGSRSALAITLAGEMLQGYSRGKGELLLVTDSLDPAERMAAQQAARQFAGAGFQLLVYAVATSQGGFIPDSETGYLPGAGEPVTSRLTSGDLQRLAGLGGGEYQPVTPASGDIDGLLAAVAVPEPADKAAEPGPGTVWREGGPWLIALLLPLALLLFRHGSLFTVCLAVAIISPPAEALEWRDLWLTPHQQGMQALERQQPDEAERLFSDPLWRGIAQYQQGKYTEALASFSQAPSALGHFNRGNTLVHLGRLDAATAAYQQALQLDPGMADARYNLTLVEQALTALERAATADRPVPAPQKSETDKAPTRSAEALLDAPTAQDRQQPKGEAPADIGQTGAAGGGAMMMQGGEHPEQQQGTTAGEGMSEGEAERQQTAEDVARQSGRDDLSREAAEGRQQTPEIAPSHFQEPEQPARPEAMTDPAATGTQPGNRPAAGDRQQAPQEPSTTATPAAPVSTGSADEHGHNREQQQALRHWLDGIESDPGGLLREKFRREYRRHPDTSEEVAPW